MRLEAIIFDFNGVLLWDTPWHEEAWRAAAEKFRGTAVTTEEMENLNGRTNKEILAYLIGRDLQDEEAETKAELKEKLYRDIALSKGEHFRLSPGAENLFRLLRDNGILYTIATSSSLGNLSFFIRHLELDKWFQSDKIIYDDGSLPGKPAPDIFLRAANKLEISISKCLVVEDSRSGIRSAVAAKAGKIVAIGPREKHKELIELGADKAIETLAEITLEDLEN